VEGDLAGLAARNPSRFQRLSQRVAQVWERGLVRPRRSSQGRDVALPLRTAWVSWAAVHGAFRG
jgi:hypothetical protein